MSVASATGVGAGSVADSFRGTEFADRCEAAVPEMDWLARDWLARGMSKSGTGRDGNCVMTVTRERAGGKMELAGGQEKPKRLTSRQRRAAAGVIRFFRAVGRASVTASGLSLLCLEAVAAVDGTVAARLEGDRGLLAASGADDRGCRGGAPAPVAAATLLIGLLGLTTGFATLRGRIAAFLIKALIRSGISEFSSTIAARELYVTGHFYRSLVSLHQFHCLHRF